MPKKLLCRFVPFVNAVDLGHSAGSHGEQPKLGSSRKQHPIEFILAPS
jgi:hypothetical protein